MNKNELSNKIIGCAIEVHRQLGPGLLESAYQECLGYELMQEGINVEKELPTTEGSPYGCLLFTMKSNLIMDIG